MKYTREEFISLMVKVEDKYRRANHVADIFDDIFGGDAGQDFFEIYGFNWYMDYLVETLEKMFAENISNNADVISWFIYENDFGCGGGLYAEKVTIKTPGDLYDYMMREK